MSDIIESVTDFFREKKIVAIIASILIFFAFSALIIVAIQTAPEKKVAASSVPEIFTSDSALLIPQGPKILDSYYPSRTTKEKWDAADSEAYLTLPDGDALKNLEVANDALVSSILEAAP